MEIPYVEHYEHDQITFFEKFWNETQDMLHELKWITWWERMIQFSSSPKKIRKALKGWKEMFEND